MIPSVEVFFIPQLMYVARSPVYAMPRPVSDSDLELMKLIDWLHLEMPFSGLRMLRDLLALKSIKVGRKHIATLMKRMGIEALYRKPQSLSSRVWHGI